MRECGSQSASRRSVPGLTTSLGASSTELEEPTTQLAEDPALEAEIQTEAERAEAGERPEPGIFITFEGCEGVGKTTQVHRAAVWLMEEQIPVLATREPGATPLGQTLRRLLLESQETGIATLAELFLMLADRAQHVSQVIRPSLAEGLVVLCDRYNDSTLAYQGRAGGLDITAVKEACALATGGLQPRLTILLDMEPEAAFRRIDGVYDRMEARGLEFHSKVREAFRDLAAEEPHRMVIIDASQPEEDVARQVRRAIQAVLPAGRDDR